MRACNNPDCNKLIEDAALDRCPHCGHRELRPMHPSSSSSVGDGRGFICGTCGEVDDHADQSLQAMLQWLDSAPDTLNS